MSTSTTERLPLADAERLALEVVELLRPATTRIEVAGSIRRRKETIGDIEIVAIPRMGRGADMFGDVSWSENELELICSHAVDTGVLEMRRSNGRTAWGPKFKAALYRGFPLDLFSVIEPAQWGVIFLIRTGPADYSHRFVTTRGHGGMMPEWARIKDGALWRVKRDGFLAVVPTLEERDVYAEIGQLWIAPEVRA